MSSCTSHRSSWRSRSLASRREAWLLLASSQEKARCRFSCARDPSAPFDTVSATRMCVRIEPCYRAQHSYGKQGDARDNALQKRGRRESRCIAYITIVCDPTLLALQELDVRGLWHKAPVANASSAQHMLHDLLLVRKFGPARGNVHRCELSSIQHKLSPRSRYGFLSLQARSAVLCRQTAAASLFGAPCCGPSGPSTREVCK